MIELGAIPRGLERGPVLTREAPTQLEVGAGKGAFILECALAHPDENFIAVERARRYAKLIEERAAKRKLKNIRVVCADAVTFLAQCIPDASLAAIHVYFPDPWPKKSHHKRRIFQAPFVQEVERALEPGGNLSVASDVKSYMELIVECVAQSGPSLALTARTANVRPAPFPAVTSFERKYRLAGRSVYFVVWEKAR